MESRTRERGNGLRVLHNAKWDNGQDRQEFAFLILDSHSPPPHFLPIYPPFFVSKKVQFYFNFFFSYYILLSTFNNFISGWFSFTPSNNTTFSKPATTPLLNFFLFFFFRKPHCLLPPTELCSFPMSVKSLLAIIRTFYCIQELGMHSKLLVELSIAVLFFYLQYKI